jgi:hypothetical protein
MLIPGNRVLVEPSKVSYTRVKFFVDAALCKHVFSPFLFRTFPSSDLVEPPATKPNRVFARRQPAFCEVRPDGTVISRVLKDRESLWRRTQYPAIYSFQNFKQEH